MFSGLVLFPLQANLHTMTVSTSTIADLEETLTERCCAELPMFTLALHHEPEHVDLLFRRYFKRSLMLYSIMRMNLPLENVAYISDFSSKKQAPY